MRPDIPDLCVVVPAHNEELNLPILAREVGLALQGRGITYSILFVDDGSTDRTAAVIRDLARTDDHVAGLILSRNFGQQAAVSMGLMYARGAAIAVLDADLQDRPADLLAL